MTPPCRVFPASELESEIQTTDGQRLRKGGGRIDLSACELLAMVQYECQIDRPELANSPVWCWPVQRWFRRYVSFLWICLFPLDCFHPAEIYIYVCVCVCCRY